MRPARVRVPLNFDGARSATVELNRNALLLSVRLYRRRKRYELPLADVAQMVAWTIMKLDAAERRARRKRARLR